MNRHRIELLITLVLFTVVSAAVWTSSPSEARGRFGLGAANGWISTKPAATPTSGDPDIGQATPQPPPKLPKSFSGSGNAKSHGPMGWVSWTGRIWATLYLRVGL